MVIRVVLQPIVLIVPASSGTWTLRTVKVLSDDHDLKRLLFTGIEGPSDDVLDWLLALSELLVKPDRRGSSDRARRRASQLAASLMTNLADHLDNWAQEQNTASVHLQMHTQSWQEQGSAWQPRVEVSNVEEETGSWSCTRFGS